MLDVDRWSSTVADYKFTFRGESLVKAVARGERLTACRMLETLDFAPEPLLAEPDLSALRQFLSQTPPRTARRTKAQKAEAARLAALIDASDADALIPEARQHLRNFVAGEVVNRRGAPRLSYGEEADRLMADNLCAFVYREVKEALANPKKPSEIRQYIVEESAWRNLPDGERALRIAHEILRKLPRVRSTSPQALANRISQLRRRNSLPSSDNFS